MQGCVEITLTAVCKETDDYCIALEWYNESGGCR